MPNNLMAVLYVMLAVFCFNINDSLMKDLFAAEPVYVIVATRAVLVLSILTLALLVLVRRNPLAGLRDRGTLLFGFGESMVAMPYLTALMFLSLGVSAALIFTAPVITTALGALVLRERVGLFRWGAVVLGFTGVILVALGEPLTRYLAPDLGLAIYGPLEETEGGAMGGGPGLSGPMRWILLAPLFAALSLSVRDLVSRTIPSKLPTAFNAAYSALFVCLSATLCFFVIVPLFPSIFQPTLQGRSLFGVLADFNTLVWFKLLVSASLISVAYYFGALALRTGELSVISPFRYVGLPGAMMLDVVLFRSVPQWNEYTGGVLIVLAGLVIIWREARVRQLRGRHPASRRG